MATAHLLVPRDDRSEVLAIGARLPTVPVGEMLRAGETLGLDLAVVRTLARHGDDRIVLCELLDADARAPQGAGWIDVSRLVDESHVSTPARAAIAAEFSTPDLLPWEQRGWFREIITWVDTTLRARNLARTGRPVQLRHWGLSAVLRIPTDDGDVIVKQVPRGLRGEGQVTAWLAALAPGGVPAVLAEDDELCRFVMEGVSSSGPVEHDDVVALAALQEATVTRTSELEGFDLCDRRPSALLDAGMRLAGRDDLLFDSSWSLASTDTRRPPRALVADDVAALLRLVDNLEPLARRLEAQLPSGAIVHGDFHTGNVIRNDHRAVVIDWGLAALGHPMFDLPAWPSWDRDDDQALVPFLEAWGFSVNDWKRARPLAHLFHAVTAAHVADAMPSAHRRSDWAAGVQKSVLRVASG